VCIQQLSRKVLDRNKAACEFRISNWSEHFQLNSLKSVTVAFSSFNAAPGSR
jgi:hypothetical protein